MRWVAIWLNPTNFYSISTVLMLLILIALEPESENRNERCSCYLLIFDNDIVIVQLAYSGLANKL